MDECMHMHGKKKRSHGPLCVSVERILSLLTRIRSACVPACICHTLTHRNAATLFLPKALGRSTPSD